MKNKFLLLIFIAIILSACSLTSRIDSQNLSSETNHPQTTEVTGALNSTPAVTPSAPIATEFTADVGESQDTQPEATDQPAVTGGQETPDQPAVTQEPTGPAPTQVNDSALVNVTGLNLRMGPGYGYGVIRVLPEGQRVQVLGRSVNGDWIEVMLDEQSGGWVYGRYLDASLDLAALPVKEAYGGPYSESGQPANNSTYSLYMSINGRQATIDLGRFPANTQVEALLGVPGESANLLVASGQTNDNGSAQLDFVMPEKWQNGSPLSEQELLLEVRSADGSYHKSATIQYDH